MFEAGLFFILLGIAFIILVVKIPYRGFLYWLSAGIFIYLGVVIYNDNDIAFEVSTTDGVNTINQTNYIIGQTIAGYNETAMPLAFFLVILGVIIGLIGFVMFAHPPKNIIDSK